MSSEVEIRAVRQQLLLEEQIALFDYWASKREADHTAPMRQSIDPVEIPRLLPSISLISTEQSLGTANYRLAGTRLRDVFGCEATGRAVENLIQPGQRDYWQAVYEQVVDQARPTCGVCPAVIDTPTPTMHFWMRLPLTDDSGKVTVMLGHDWLLEQSKAEAEARRAGVSLDLAMRA